MIVFFLRGAMFLRIVSYTQNAIGHWYSTLCCRRSVDFWMKKKTDTCACSKREKNCSFDSNKHWTIFFFNLHCVFFFYSVSFVINSIFTITVRISVISLKRIFAIVIKGRTQFDTTKCSRKQKHLAQLWYVLWRLFIRSNRRITTRGNRVKYRIRK